MKVPLVCLAFIIVMSFLKKSSDPLLRWMANNHHQAQRWAIIICGFAIATILAFDSISEFRRKIELRDTITSECVADAVDSFHHHVMHAMLVLVVGVIVYKLFKDPLRQLLFPRQLVVMEQRLASSNARITRLGFYLKEQLDAKYQLIGDIRDHTTTSNVVSNVVPASAHFSNLLQQLLFPRKLVVMKRLLKNINGRIARLDYHLKKELESKYKLTREICSIRDHPAASTPVSPDASNTSSASVIPRERLNALKFE